jgi:hypothetical protein
MKLCPDCNIEKEEDDFIVGSVKKPRCKPCENKRRREANKVKKDNASNTTKTCKECKKEKKGDEFEFGTLLCKICFREKDKEANNRPSETDLPKTCRTCNTKKLATDFRKKELICKECNKQRLYKWREENPEKFQANCKRYREKQESKDKRNTNRREKYWNNIQERLTQLYRNRVRLCVKKKSSFPRNTHIDYTSLLGCHWEYLIKWLEFNMTSDMTWDNYGIYWHIDHIYPCAKFNLEKDDERKRCFNWTNLAPLNGIENIKKSDTIDTEMIFKYRKLATDFLQRNPDISVLTDVLPEDIKLLVTSGALTTKD